MILDPNSASLRELKKLEKTFEKRSNAFEKRVKALAKRIKALDHIIRKTLKQ